MDKATHRIKGEYTSVDIRIQSRFRGYSWNVDFDYSIVGNPEGTPEERIAYFISHLPDREAMEMTTSLTFDTFDFWVKCRDSSLLMAVSFLTTKGSSSDLLLQALSDGKVDRWRYEYDWLLIETFKALWYLLRDYEDAIFEMLNKSYKVPFNNSTELFCRLVQDEIHFHFSPYLSSFHQHNENNIAQIDKLKLKKHKGSISREDEERLNQLIGSSSFDDWHSRVLLATHFLALQGNKNINTRLDQFWKLVDDLSKMRFRAFCNPLLKRIIEPSFYIQNGIFTKDIYGKWKSGSRISR